MSQKLTTIEQNILTPAVREESISDVVSESETEWSEGDSDDVVVQPRKTSKGCFPSTDIAGENSKLQHPHFGGKRPKEQQPPPRCINVLCKQQKHEKDEEIRHLKEEVRQLKEELRKYLT